MADAKCSLTAEQCMALLRKSGITKGSALWFKAANIRFTQVGDGLFKDNGEVSLLELGVTKELEQTGMHRGSAALAARHQLVGSGK